LDGAFQTASGLFRLDSGQFPGKEFFPYIGIGPLLLLYPAFKILGSDLSASVFAAHFMTLIFGALSISVIWHFIFRPKSFIVSLAAGAVIFAIPITVTNYLSLPLHHSLSFASDPGNSLRPIRAVVPYLMVITYYLLIHNIKSVELRYILSGIITGFVLSLMSNDFAIPSAGLFMAFIAISAFKKGELKLQNALLFIFSALLSSVTLLILITHGHPLDLLRYNFMDVTRDQWWFFGPYGESTRIFYPQQVYRIFSQETIFPFIILALSVVVSQKTQRVEHGLLTWIGTVLLTGGILPSIGGHLGGYFGGFYFWGITTFVLAFFRLAYIGIEKILKFNTRSLSIIWLGTASIAFTILLVATMHIMWQYKTSLAEAKNDSNRFFVPELGGYLGLEWKEYLNLVRQTETEHVVEEYWGLWSAVRRIFPPWPVDSVIHAFGRTREVAIEKLQSAKVIITTRYSAAPEWQPWNLSQNFWLYDELLTNWTPYALSPTTIVWRKNDRGRLHKSVETNLGNNGYSVIIKADKPGFYRMEVEYSFRGRGLRRHLLMVRNNLSFGADAGGYVSIDPSGEKVIFPAYIANAGPTKLNFKVLGGGQYDLKIKSALASRILFVNEHVLNAPGLVSESFFLTDNNWLRGIARNWAGFFLPNTSDFARDFQPGRYVLLGDGSVRKIIRVEFNGPYLNIFLEGEPLDADKVGLPSHFRIIAGEVPGGNKQ
jgi:hypothetical protein